MVEYTMGKIESNKKRKKNTLFQTAFELFKEKGFAKTTISDIVNRAGLAKGTFYLYFKDKYDLRDKLISHKTGQLFEQAHDALESRLEQDPSVSLENFEDKLLFILDYIIEILQNDKGLLRFISKNLSWGIFRNAMHKNVSGPGDSGQDFYQYVKDQMEKDRFYCEEPELMLFTITELVGATCYSCIIYESPVTMDRYLPWLHQSVSRILDMYSHP